MSRIVIAGIGSRGDVAPLTGLGVRLQQAGHEVVLAGHESFAELIEGCGLRFRLMELNFGFEGDYAEIQRRTVSAFNTPAGFRVIGQGLLAALRDEPADLLLLTPYAEFAGHPFAEATGIPTIGLRLQPTCATAEYPPAVAGVWSLGPYGNRWAADIGAWLVDRRYGAVIGEFRQFLGLPKVSARELRRRRTAAKWPILHGYSPTLAPRPVDWREGIDVTGFWWPARPVDFEPPAELVEFLAAGPAPVFVSFGSNINDAKRTAELGEIIRTALRRAGVRGIVQAGWTGLEVADDDIISLGDIPYDWLFPHLAAAVHHCGAGTSAAALRAAVPTIGVPEIPEQQFWAHRLELLGGTAGITRQPALTANWLTDAIRTATTDTGLRANLSGVAAQLAEEDGAELVLRTIESVIARSSV
ncbi:glycosyltransferase [Nocardia sp. NBC_01503]|uniref:glycosyltransferase n=1 Tax=Nocardia sp. NBC_01503 TaxID=2975997 RepID=UPI002E7BCBD2|nr:glycosyltransferase [Nocardia sp. NBC_01503]WTL33292.1 glycosyltransferase [Nocardia sp. NBC_01503]